MNEKKPFIVSHWDDFFLTNKIRSLERRKKTNLYLATMGCLAFALFGAIFMRGPAVDNPAVSALAGQRAILAAVVIGIVLLVTTLIATMLSRTPQDVAILESALMKGFGTALDSSDLNPNKKDSKKSSEVRT
ncbi:MAG TPA: hypothetical protein VKT49_23310 [Bryobacteraceae bacterium]|nr:hypothetical protein [Bryobacteraceae bacterium]